jgi:uncharacterized membrane protein YdbT with pleckstrin-like domain
VGFPESVLTTDERVVLHVHPHWKALVGPMLWLAVSVAAVTAAWTALSDWNQVVLLMITGVGLGLVAVLSFWPWLRWRTTHYVFTNERVILREGILARSGRDIPLGRVNDVSFQHGLVDRMLGCGTLTIESAGERGQVVLPSLPHVEKTQSVLYELVEQDRDQHTFDDSDREAIVKGAQREV